MTIEEQSKLICDLHQLKYNCENNPDEVDNAVTAKLISLVLILLYEKNSKINQQQVRIQKLENLVNHLHNKFVEERK